MVSPAAFVREASFHRRPGEGLGLSRIVFKGKQSPERVITIGRHPAIGVGHLGFKLGGVCGWIVEEGFGVLFSNPHHARKLRARALVLIFDALAFAVGL